MNTRNELLAVSFWILSASFTGQAAAVETAIMNPNDTADTLNFLIERAVESEKGYEEAAARADYAGLKVRLLSASIQREQFAKELQSIVSELERTAVTEETFDYLPHSPWFVSAGPGFRNDQDILLLLKPREEKTLAVYRQALNQNLPEDIHEVVQKQADKVESFYNWLSKNARRD